MASALAHDLTPDLPSFIRRKVSAEKMARTPLRIVADLAEAETSILDADEATRTSAKVAELYKTYGPVIYRRCRRLLRNPEAAQDATQEVFLRLLRTLERDDGRDELLPWLYRVATNHCLNVIRDTRLHGEEELPEDHRLGGTVSGPGVDAVLMRTVLQRFDAVTQTVAVSVIVEGMELEEVAAIIGASRHTVARKLNRFLEQARAFLIASGSVSPSELEHA
jgi:RNA polymerase sigma-70 factor, ECF subfamily